MSRPPAPKTLVTLKAALAVAERQGYALGSFAPRYTAMIRPILRAAERARSPAIVQISQREMERYGVTPAAFGDAFFRALEAEGSTVPVVLHLDHTFEMPVIEAAIAAGFTSVMIDQSAAPFTDNVRVTRAVVAYAHARGVSVEAELGRIGTTDFVETEEDEEQFTDPDEAGRFVAETGVDALAVAVGTAHGHYTTRKPRVDLARLEAIRARTPVHLVLHGGSGVPANMIQAAVRLPGGGISKVNIATDLEHAMLTALGRTERMTDRRLPGAARARAAPRAGRRRARRRREDRSLSRQPGPRRGLRGRRRLRPRRDRRQAARSVASARCRNMLRRASSSISALKACFSRSAATRAAAGRPAISSCRRLRFGKRPQASSPMMNGTIRAQPQAAMSTMV